MLVCRVPQERKSYSIRKQEDFPLCSAPQAKILHIVSGKTDVLPYKMGAAGDFLGVRTLKLGFTLENERPRQDFLVPQPISPDLRIWSPENEGGDNYEGGDN